MSIKLVNFKCPDCGHEDENLFTKEEPEFMICSKCGTHMLHFNFKNNSQRVFIQDPPSN